MKSLLTELSALALIAAALVGCGKKEEPAAAAPTAASAAP